jgi:preprotein translocase subunit SecG
MQWLLNVMQVVQILSALVMIGLVLIQQGKGADMGASFGSGASGSLFGATGSANFLSRSTAVCATVFFCCTLALAYFGSEAMRPGTAGGGTSILDRAAPAASAVPSSPDQIPGAAPATPAAPAASAAPVAPAASPASAAIPAAPAPGEIPAR